MRNLKISPKTIGKMNMRTLEEMKFLIHTPVAKRKRSLVPSQINRKPYTKNLATSVPATQSSMSISRKKELQRMLKSKKSAL